MFLSHSAIILQSQAYKFYFKLFVFIRWILDRLRHMHHDLAFGLSFQIVFLPKPMQSPSAVSFSCGHIYAIQP